MTLDVDVIALHDGRVMQVHPARECLTPCPIHEPSDHPLKDAPLNWRPGPRLWERICPHGCGHPDPDDLAFKQATMLPAAYRMAAFDSHGCCGCCLGSDALD